MQHIPRLTGGERSDKAGTVQRHAGKPILMHGLTASRPQRVELQGKGLVFR